MPTSSREQFLNEVLSNIKFRRDRPAIAAELTSHLEDKTDYYLAQGHDRAQAEQLAVDDMGDAKQIGVELNKQHNPMLGWALEVTNALLGLVLLANLLFVVPGMALQILDGDSERPIPSPINTVYHTSVDETVKLDDTVIHFTDVYYDREGTLTILYEHHNPILWRRIQSFGSIGEISDNLGNTYFAGHGGDECNFRTLEHFSPRANMVSITYDMYNRKYEVRIPLPVGDIND